MPINTFPRYSCMYFSSIWPELRPEAAALFQQKATWTVGWTFKPFYRAVTLLDLWQELLARQDEKQLSTEVHIRQTIKRIWEIQCLRRASGVLPQQLGCLQVGDTGATPPVPATLPFQEAPGQTSSSGLWWTDRSTVCVIYLQRIVLTARCEGCFQICVDYEMLRRSIMEFVHKQ